MSRKVIRIISQWTSRIFILFLGLPEYGVEPFDPFHAQEVYQKRSGPFFNYKLVLRNVTESGWTQSQVTNFKTDMPKSQVQVTQFFPDKRLQGIYEFDGVFLGRKIKNSGSWNLALFDYVQTLSVSRKPQKELSSGKYMKRPPIKVKCNIQTCKKLELHIGNLAGGRTIVENVLDWVINTAWQPGFVLLSPLINDLVGTAFSEIFNKDFQYFPFESVFH
ncbi:unnamed protein product [Ceutorhynchus assimilis]|uniref:Uncharacterized protein n=1 Tax=Ceutorhynchus assimilis TaxID=467358 RepID=A0A9N9MSN9_9CUCU|nr:unnamed protein product [Ceutorhynchus assimilis]